MFPHPKPLRQAQSSPGRERALSGFASLLSSALAIGSDASAGQALGDSGDTLQCFISPTVAEDETCFILPSLMLSHVKVASYPASNSLEHSVSSKLARPMGLRRHELPAIPMMLLANLSESFMTLIDSRLRSSFAALVRQCQSHKNLALPRVLVGLLGSLEDPISSTTFVTSFRTLPASKRNQPGVQVLPLVMEAVVDLSILGELVTVKILAPGTIHGCFDGGDMISRAELVIDTMALLHSMMKQARYAVRKAVDMFANIASMLVIAMSSKKRVPALGGLQSKHPDFARSSRAKSQPNFRSLMQPPPRRVNSNLLGGSGLLDRRQQNSADQDKLPFNESTRNATWDSPAKKGDVLSRDGLALLTTAAGLKRKQGTGDEDDRRKRVRIQSSLPGKSEVRKVTSCPAL